MKSTSKSNREVVALIGVVAAIIALVSARPHARSWNDGSRLATVESLVDHGTLAIDHSIFVNVPPLEIGRPSPYSSKDEALMQSGTKDKMRIGGHYYSDKSPLPALYLAAVYQTVRWLGMPSAVERPDRFCLLMTWASSGLAYVVVVLCMFSIAGRIGLDQSWSLLVTLFLGAGTITLPYAQQVNNHILLLALAMLVFRLLLISNADGWTIWRAIWIGNLAGIAYTIDLGAGPPLCLLVCAFGCKRFWLAAGALPWIALHHVINYQIGGTIGPANANPVFFDWPGSPFNEQNMTGGLAHRNPMNSALYALDMLFGKKGFLGHDLILLVPLFGMLILLRHRYAERGISRLGMLWALTTWLLYAATSTNQGGSCCSIRWFVPLLAPGFVGLCILLRDCPECRRATVVFGGGGLLLGIGMAIRGPWFPRLMPFYWILYAGTIAVCAILLLATHRHRVRSAVFPIRAAGIALPCYRDFETFAMVGKETQFDVDRR